MPLQQPYGVIQFEHEERQLAIETAHKAACAGRLVAHARHLTLRLPATWPWATTLARAFIRLRTLRPASG